MRNLMLAVGVFALLIGISGCVVHTHDRPADEGYIESGHVHSVDCGHYYCDGQWYYRHGHHHGPGCGHMWRSGMWIVID